MLRIVRQVVSYCGTSLVLLSGLACPSSAVVVRYSFSINGSSIGTVDVRLFQSAMPNTVTNFLNYVDDNDWDGSFIHRRSGLADSGVGVVQGGGFIVPTTGLIEDVGGQLFLNFDQVPTDPPINDEPGGGVAGPSNLRGTIAMAKSGPNTATSQWYFNTIDNTVLDNPNQSSGGFSAFGRVLGNGMNVIDSIVALPRFNVGGAFNTLPVFDAAKIQNQVNVFTEDVVLVNDVSRLNIPAGDYDFNGVVNALDFNIWKSTFGSKTNAAADGNGNGIVDAADFTIWRNTFGQMSLPGSGSGGLTVVGVPEPGSLTILGSMSGLLVLAARRRRPTR